MRPIKKCITLLVLSLLLSTANNLFAQSTTFTADSLTYYGPYKLGTKKSLYIDSLVATEEKFLYKSLSKKLRVAFGDTVRSVSLKFDKKDNLIEITIAYESLPGSVDKGVLKEKVDRMYSRIKRKLNSDPKIDKESGHFTFTWKGNDIKVDFEIISLTDWDLAARTGELKVESIARLITLRAL